MALAANAAVAFGVDRVNPNDLPAPAARVGLVTNDAATTATDPARPARVTLRARGLNLVRLFGPEHGLTATAADGAKVGDGADPVTGLPVISLYGERVRPLPEQLADLDALLFDIPDAGARFYTYIWTLSHLLEACADAGKPLIVLDRPNPLGGRLEDAEGPMLDESFVSTFVGRWSIPVRHSLTAGELATLWNAERRIGCDLRVVRCEGWRREMHWPDTRLPFVPMSPAMRNYETALVYPGTCFLEGTNLSEGRGTDWPLRVVGAPWLEADATVDDLNALRLPGLRFSRFDFTPTARKFSGERCAGVRVDLVDAHAVRPVAMGLHLLAVVARRHRGRFEWLAYKTAVNRAGDGHFDRLVGVPGVRASVEGGSPDIAALTRATGWADRVRPVLLYA